MGGFQLFSLPNIFNARWFYWASPAWHFNYSSCIINIKVQSCDNFYATGVSSIWIPIMTQCQCNIWNRLHILTVKAVRCLERLARLQECKICIPVVETKMFLHCPPQFFKYNYRIKSDCLHFYRPWSVKRLPGYILQAEIGLEKIKVALSPITGKQNEANLPVNGKESSLSIVES